MLKKVMVADNAYELRDSLENSVINVAVDNRSDGSVSVKATVPKDIADDIIAGLSILYALRRGVTTDKYSGLA